MLRINAIAEFNGYAAFGAGFQDDAIDFKIGIALLMLLIPWIVIAI
jgi:hypothetical protein